KDSAISISYSKFRREARVKQRGKESAVSRTIEQATMRKVGLRLIPFLCICYIVAFIGRVNVGFAALSMSGDLGLSPTAFGFGSGLFFIGYFLFEVPSNLLLERFGARLWIARVMVTWGIISMGCAF